MTIALPLITKKNRKIKVNNINLLGTIPFVPIIIKVQSNYHSLLVMMQKKNGWSFNKNLNHFIQQEKT
jgi:hypothetical protein